MVSSNKKSVKKGDTQLLRVKMVRYLARRGVSHEIAFTKGKKNKGVKDPNRPKRARSAYIFFCKEERPKLAQEEKEVKPVKLMQLLADRWNKLTAKKKKRYTQMAEEDKERYEKVKIEAQKYEKPKRPRGAYNFFVAQEREALAEDYNANEIFQELGKKWKVMTKDDKAPFVDMEHKDKERHKREFAKWEKIMSAKNK